MSVVQILAGNVARCPFRPVPDDASVVALADVSCWILTRDGTKIDITDDVVEVAANDFRADWLIPDAATAGFYYFRWESNLPSAKITLEGEDTKFRVRASVFPTP